MTLFNFPQNTEISALIFDIDNTLYTNAAYIKHQIDVQVQRFADLEGISFEQAEQRIADARAAFAAEHDGAKTSFALIMKGFGYPTEESIKWRSELIQPERYLKKDEKLRHILEKLATRYKIISVTNNPVDIGWRNLKAIGIDDLFMDIVGLDTCHKSKPAREPFLKGLEILGEPPEKCVSIGDRYDIDIATPLELGMRGVLVDGSKELDALPFL
jgi:phosphoglycolate phosphatase/putative hydrolase of the HAD superfamily